MTAELTQSVKDALAAFEALKTEILPLKAKLDVVDEAKYQKMEGLISTAIEDGQKARAAMEGMKKEQEQLYATVSRLGLSSSNPEQKSKELRVKCKKLFNDFARLKDDENKRYFDSFLKQQVTDEAEYKAMSVNVDPSGGYLTTPDFGGIIQTKIFETSPMRQLCSVMEIGTDTYEVLLDDDQASAGWVGETQPRTSTTTPILGKLKIFVNELYAQPQATQKLLDDAIIDVEAWLADKVSQIFSRTENTAFVSGSGVLQPKGILSYANGTDITQQQIQQVPSTSASTFTYAGLVNLQASMKEDYQGNATFLIQRSSIANLMNIVDGINRPIFNLTFDKNTGIAAGIMGRPLIFGNDVPAVGANALAMIYGDFRRAYQIVDRAGVRVLRDPYTAKPNVLFYTTKRTGGAVVNFEAIKIQKISVS